jgi:hypothetical protein
LAEAIERADALLRRIHEELARRHVLQVPGPWSGLAPSDTQAGQP